jgi:hypothetical protein
MRRPGRPPLDDTDDSVGVHVTMTGRDYDALYARAQRERVTIPELVRQAVKAANVEKDGKK